MRKTLLSVAATAMLTLAPIAAADAATPAFGFAPVVADTTPAPSPTTNTNTSTVHDNNRAGNDLRDGRADFDNDGRNDLPGNGRNDLR